MGKDSTMCRCVDVQMCRFNQHLNIGLVGEVVVVTVGEAIGGRGMVHSKPKFTFLLLPRLTK